MGPGVDSQWLATNRIAGRVCASRNRLTRSSVGLAIEAGWPKISQSVDRPGGGGDAKP